MIGCTNTRAEGRFVGDFCAACDAALRSGNFEFGTSVVHKQARAIKQSTQNYVAACHDRDCATEQYLAALKEIERLRGIAENFAAFIAGEHPRLAQDDDHNVFEFMREFSPRLQSEP